MKAAMIGTGYVGLVSGACFADEGNEVLCIDINKERIENLKQGKIPFYEPGLEEIVLRNHKNGNLNFSTELIDALKYYDFLFLCLPTPKDLKSKKVRADLSYIYKVVHDSGKLKSEWGGYKLFVNKSTVPPGTNKRLLEILESYTAPINFGVASNPEFLKEGDAVQDFQKPDRIVIGVNNEKEKSLMLQLYASHLHKNKIIVCNPIEAEMIKYTANSILATKISIINSVARVCDLVGANIEKVREGVCSDHRIGWQFFWPSAGYGGSCFPKDVKEFIGFAEDAGHPLKIFEAAEEINKGQKRYFARKVINYFGNVRGKQFGMWGLSFKPETDDMREAPSLDIIRCLTKLGARVKVYDPQARETGRKALLAKHVDSSKFIICEKKYEVLDGSDALILLTEWKEFRTPDFTEIKNTLKQPVIFDGKNIYGRDDLLRATMEKLGFDYLGIGTKYLCRQK